MGPVYYAYGHALLCKAEDSVDVFGDSVPKQKQEGEEEEANEEDDAVVSSKMKIPEKVKESEDMKEKVPPPTSSIEGKEKELEDEDDVEEEKNQKKEVKEEKDNVVMEKEGEKPGNIGNGDDKEGDEGNGNGEDNVEDLEIAWENLDICRVIYDRNEPIVGKELRAKVYNRLGDLQRLNGNNVQAIDDYNIALMLLNSILPFHHRKIGNMFYSLALAHLYASTTEGIDGTPKANQMRLTSIDYYRKCRDSLRSKLHEMKSGRLIKEQWDTPDEDTELAELVDELEETIKCTESDVNQWTGPKKSSEPQTTIGFGNPSSSSSLSTANNVSVLQPVKKDIMASSSSSSLMASTNAFSSSSTSLSSTTKNFGQGGVENAQPEVNTIMTVKKKIKPITSTTTSEKISAPLNSQNEKENEKQKEEKPVNTTSTTTSIGEKRKFEETIDSSEVEIDREAVKHAKK